MLNSCYMLIHWKHSDFPLFSHQQHNFLIIVVSLAKGICHIILVIVQACHYHIQSLASLALPGTLNAIQYLLDSHGFWPVLDRRLVYCRQALCTTYVGHSTNPCNILLHTTINIKRKERPLWELPTWKKYGWCQWELFILSFDQIPILKSSHIINTSIFHAKI